jgi:hypothetical protein
MDSRTLMSGLIEIYNQFNTPEKLSKKAEKLLEDLRELTVDPTVNPTTQSLILLRDISQYFQNIEATLSLGSQEENEKFRKQLTTQLTYLIMKFASANNIYVAPKQNPLDLCAKVITSFSNNNSEAFSDPKNYRQKELVNFNYDTAPSLDKAEGGEFSHPTKKVNKLPPQLPAANETLREKFTADWYAKYCPNRTIAARELVTQEFYRFFMEFQPKTRLATDEHNRAYIVSKGTADAVSLADANIAGMRKGLDAGILTGFGTMSTLDEALEEVDAKLRNIFINITTGEVFKIDGDWCLAGLRDASFSATSTITARDLATFPMVQDYQPHNWLGVRNAQVMNVEYAIPNEHTLINTTPGQELANEPVFRGEVNNTILMLTTMPQELLETFISAYLNDPVEINLLTGYMSSRFEMLRNAAINTPSFQKFLADNNAVEMGFEASWQTMLKFIPSGKNLLLSDAQQVTALRESYLDNFQKLKNDALKIPAATPVAPTVVAPQQPYFPPPPPRVPIPTANAEKKAEPNFPPPPPGPPRKNAEQNTVPNFPPPPAPPRANPAVKDAAKPGEVKQETSADIIKRITGTQTVAPTPPPPAAPVLTEVPPPMLSALPTNAPPVEIKQSAKERDAIWRQQRDKYPPIIVPPPQQRAERETKITVTPPEESRIKRWTVDNQSVAQDKSEVRSPLTEIDSNKLTTKPASPTPPPLLSETRKIKKTPPPLPKTVTNISAEAKVPPPPPPRKSSEDIIHELLGVENIPPAQTKKTVETKIDLNQPPPLLSQVKKGAPAHKTGLASPHSMFKSGNAENKKVGGEKIKNPKDSSTKHK